MFIISSAVASISEVIHCRNSFVDLLICEGSLLAKIH
jgi:hypothetical protein